MSISGVIGTTWPWNKYPEFVENEDVIDLAVRDVIFTILKERKMNNAFGSEVIRLVFENKGDLLVALATREITVALSQHLSYVKVLNIDVQEGRQDTDPVDIKVTYEYQGLVSTVDVQVPTL